MDDISILGTYAKMIDSRLFQCDNQNGKQVPLLSKF